MMMPAKPLLLFRDCNIPPALDDLFSFSAGGSFAFRVIPPDYPHLPTFPFFFSLSPVLHLNEFSINFF